MTILLEHADLHVLEMRTRMPFRYGIATLTALPHVFLRVRAVVDGMPAEGLASEGLAPKWFTKDPDETPEREVAEMLRVIRHAVGLARGIAAPSVFSLWREVYESQRAWAAGAGIPDLLAHFGVSLVERALLDAACKAAGRPFAACLHDGTLGFEPAACHPELEGTAWRSFLPEPTRRLAVRHTVGLSDPLTEADVPAGERLDDGLPQSLEACLQAYGLRWLKIKLRAEPEVDADRLGRIAALAAACDPAPRMTLDGNETFHDAETFRSFWDGLAARPELRTFLERVELVEQPFHRSLALSEELGAALRAWSGRPRLIIDESDAALDSLPTALERGYAGTSHKNCKGVFKGLANACLLRKRAAENPSAGYVLTAEDLANVGPVALLQDLAVVGVLGLTHAERNGHHYFAGLSMFPPDVQEAVTSAHGDLYRFHPRGFAALRIDDGTVSLDSVLEAPFGVGIGLDPARFAPLAMEEAAGA